MERPDLSNVDQKVKQYIAFLEEQLQSLQTSKKSRSLLENDLFSDQTMNASLPAEQPTKINILTISKDGMAKRTPRHHYTPQRRGGMGVFDLELQKDDYPSILCSLDENRTLIVFTNQARVFRVKLSTLPESPLRSRGQEFMDKYQLESGEYIAAVLPERPQGYIAMVSINGRVRALRHHLFGEHMRPGTVMYSYKEFGRLVSACWTEGDSDLFILTKNGMAIRFNEKVIPPQGDTGIRLMDGDEVAAITAVNDDSSVFMVGADGKGTARLMSGFAPNKSAGGSGKIAMRNSHLIGAVTIDPNDYIFIITRLGKIIRFRADEVPPTEGVIQGVNCIAMRNDEVTAMTRSSLHSED